MPRFQNVQQACPDGGDPDRLCISTISLNGTGDLGVAHGSALASAVWPTANLAIFYPFVVAGDDISGYGGQVSGISGRAYNKVIWMNGSAVSGNIDIGVYDILGNKKASLGSTAQSGTTAPQIATLAVQLSVGRYFLAVAMDNTTGQLVRTAPPASAARVAGVRQLTTSFPLPTSVSTWVGTTNGYVPWVSLAELTTV